MALTRSVRRGVRRAAPAEGPSRAPFLLSFPSRPLALPLSLLAFQRAAEAGIHPRRHWARATGAFVIESDRKCTKGRTGKNRTGPLRGLTGPHVDVAIAAQLATTTRRSALRWALGGLLSERS